MKILFLLSAICCFSNLSIAQNNQLNWLEGTWKGKGLTKPYSGPGLKDFILKYESKTQELTMIFGGEEFSFNFLQANKGSFDISTSKIRVFMHGVTTGENKNIYIQPSISDHTGKYLELSIFHTRYRENPYAFTILKKQ